MVISILIGRFSIFTYCKVLLKLCNISCNNILMMMHHNLHIAGPPLGRKRRASVPTRIEQLERMLDMTKFIDQLKRLIDQPIKIPGTLSVGAGQARNKQIPGKAKRDLLSVEDIWGDRTDRMGDISMLYNTTDVGERKWLLDLLMEESDPDSGGEEHITEQDLKEIVKIHRKRRKFQKEYHSDLTNSQYTYYGAGLISAFDRFSESQKLCGRDSSASSMLPPPVKNE